MAAIAQLQATKQPPIPFKPVISYQDYPTTRLVHRFTLPPPPAGAPAPATTSILKKQDTTFCPDSSDKERLIRVIEDFIDAANASNLDLYDDDLHKKARDVLGGDLKHSWDSVITSNANLKAANFNNNIRTFIGMFLPSNTFLIQQEYMLHATKPFHMDCFATAGRLRLINVLSIHLPRSSRNRLFPDDTSLKNTFYRLMLPAWQLKFNKTGNQLDDVSYKFQRLVAFMEQQRLHHDASQQFRQNRRKFNGNPNNRAQRPRYNSASPRTLFHNNNPYRPNNNNVPRNQYTQITSRPNPNGHFNGYSNGQRTNGSQTINRPNSRPNNRRRPNTPNCPHGPPRYNTRFQQRRAATNNNNRSDAHHLELDSDMYYDNSHPDENNFDNNHEDNYYQECENNGTALTQEEEQDDEDNYYQDYNNECYHQNIYHQDHDSVDY